MPHSLTTKPPETSEAIWEGEEGSDPIRTFKFPNSCPGKLNCRPTSLTRTASLSEEEVQHASTPKVNLTPSVTSARVEHLVREQQSWRSASRQNTHGDEADGKSDSLGGNGGMGGGGGDPRGAAEPGASHCQGGVRMDSYENSGNLNDRGQRATQRLLVVANRLPVSAVRDGDGWDLQLSAGGLVSALLGVKQNFETRWIGWAGVSGQDEKGRASLSEALALKGCVPVFLDDETVDLYYNGYCNNVLWPLFHYIGLPQEDRLAATRSMDAQFNAYKLANKLFADVVFSQYQEGDVVWCHDYHLMCLPMYLKELNPRMKVGWFLHTPFPSSEIYRTLPLRSELLKAVITADLIGFHTYDYARHFVSACTRILGLEGTPEGVEDQGKLTRVAAFPIGIDPDRFIQALQTEPVKEHVSQLLRHFNGRKVMLGVDRLDMIKGIPQKLLAFEMFLEKNPEWREKVLLVQIAVPSRTDVLEYQRLTSQVHEIVGRINGRYGSVTSTPIHHLDRSLAFHELCALYASTDVALVTSLRDGMNLVSYEYVACQYARSTEGVLILSEFAGGAQSLGAGAILVNPWNIREMYMAIEDALTMTDLERKDRHRHNFAHVTKHTAQAWADAFVSELNDTIVEAELRNMLIPPKLPQNVAVQRYQRSKSRLLIVGFNATITPPPPQKETPRRRGEQIRQIKLVLHPGIKDSLAILCADPNTIIVIISGSQKALLDEEFGEYNVWLAAENGMYLRHTRGTSSSWMSTLEHGLDMDWQESVRLVFQYFCTRTPQSYVESRETSLVWNYKYADMDFGKVQARNMLQHLWTGPISNAAVDVVQGSKSVEVRPMGVSKGAAMNRILREILQGKDPGFQIDYAMCIGHFLTKDEDVYDCFDPERLAERPPLDHRLATKSGPRILTKSNKVSMRRSESFSALMSPDHNISNARSNSFKERKYSQQEAGEEMGTIKSLSKENYFSCAVGRHRSAARFSLESSAEVVSFFNALADTYGKATCELDCNGESVPSVIAAGSGHHMFHSSSGSLY